MSDTPNPDSLPPISEEDARVLHDGPDGIGQTTLDRSKGIADRISDSFEEMIPGDSYRDGN